MKKKKDISVCKSAEAPVIDSKPIKLNLEVTKRCLLHCRMCYAWKMPQEPNELTIKEWKAVINSLSEVFTSDISITFGGGEPLLKEGILEVVNMCAEKGYETTIPTNAFLINRKMAQEIVNSGLEMLYVSLDSCRRELHDYLRGTKGVYDKLMEGINYIVQFRQKIPRVQIGTLICDKNLDELTTLARWACSDERLFGISFQAITIPFYTQEDVRWYTKDKYTDLWPMDMIKLKDVIDELIELKEAGYKIWNPLSQLRTFKRYYESPQEFVREEKCHLGQNALSVGSCGDVFLCFLMEPINNIRDFGFAEIWNSARATQLRQKISQCRKNCQILVNCWFDEH